MGDLVRAQLAQIQRDELKLGRVIPRLFHHNGKRIPYETLLNNWRRATRAAGYPGKLMHDFRGTRGDPDGFDAGYLDLGRDELAWP